MGGDEVANGGSDQGVVGGDAMVTAAQKTYVASLEPAITRLRDDPVIAGGGLAASFQLRGAVRSLYNSSSLD